MSDETLKAPLARPAAAPVWALLRAAAQWVGSVLKVLWLCGLAVIFLLVALACFRFNDQGRDLLRMLTDPVGLKRLSTTAAFFVSVSCWSLATWYTSRLLLTQELPGLPLPAGHAAVLRRWMPLVLGAAPPAIIAYSLYRLAAAQRPLAWGFAALDLALLALYVSQRNRFPRLREGSPPTQVAPLAWSSRSVVLLTLGLTFVLLGTFVLAPVAPARFLGAPAIVVLAVTSLLLFGAIVLTYLPLSRGYPSLLVVALLWGLACSPFNDNHEIRTVGPAPGARTLPQGDAGAAARRRLLAEDFREWLERAQAEAGTVAPDAGAERSSRPGSGSVRTYPVFIVAAAGGGIRAAYWTAAVLAHATAAVGDADTWRRHLYALSGVSGGSLGAAVHVVELRERRAADQYLAPATAMLGQDHLAPVIAFMLFPDLLQRFWFQPVRAFDRARALEVSWEQSARQALGDDAFAGRFLDLWQGDPAHVLPSLLLNATRVETGQRVIISNLPLTDAFVDAVDLLHPGPASRRKSLDDIVLSAAVHLSARYAYLSPAARVERTDGKLWGRVVDGGYFEASGADTAADLIRAICPDWLAGGGAAAVPEAQAGNPVCNHALPASLGHVVPVVLLIKNDPQGASLCDTYPQLGPVRRGFFTETGPPVEALLATRLARARDAERSIVRLIEGRDRPSGHCQEGCVLELSLAPPGADHLAQLPARVRHRYTYTDPPLGWALSAASRAAIDRRFGDPDLRGQLECIAALASGKACTTALTCPRR